MKSTNQINWKSVNRAEIARIVGITPQYVYKLLSGRHKETRKTKERLQQLEKAVRQQLAKV